jgi:hypothetical protein
MAIFKEQGQLVESMLNEYKETILGNAVFAPYFAWKQGCGRLPNPTQVSAMSCALKTFLSIGKVLGGLGTSDKDKRLLEYVKYIDKDIRKMCV